MIFYRKTEIIFNEFFDFYLSWRISRYFDNRINSNIVITYFRSANAIKFSVDWPLCVTVTQNLWSKTFGGELVEAPNYQARIWAKLLVCVSPEQLASMVTQTKGD